MTIPDALAARVEEALGRRIIVARPVSGGYSHALRGVVTLDDGQTVFLKAASSELTAGWLRTEARVYAALAGEPFLPEHLAFSDDGTTPFLILEDLSTAHFPPPWTTAQIDAVLATLAAVRGCASKMPPDCHRLTDDYDELAGWKRVAAAPEPFLALRLCSEAWLTDALPTLLQAEHDAEQLLHGDDLCHVDVRSDNLCFRPDGRVVLFDWNWVSVGNGMVDIAGWVSSLHAEGGPMPEAILGSDSGLWAALFAGFFAQNAGLPAPPTAPRVREIQKTQLDVALPWAVRSLGLPSPTVSDR